MPTATIVIGGEQLHMRIHVRTARRQRFAECEEKPTVTGESRPEDTAALAIHWINYRQDEDAAIETPIPMGPIRADLLLPTISR